MQSDILVVGKKDSILGFKTIGIQTIFWQNRKESLPQLQSNIEKGSKIIFITEPVFEEIKDFIETSSGHLYPVFVPIPDVSGSTGVSSENIRKLVLKALGTDILA